jgi:hypothetical protein
MRKLTSLTIIFAMSLMLGIPALSGIALAGTGDTDDVPSTESNGAPELSMKVIGAKKGYVDVIAEPGDRVVMNFEITNSGEAAGAADVFAANAFTLVNGGFGARKIDDPQTGVTEWLNFTSERFELEAGSLVTQTVTMDVPDNAQPGEHLTSLVIQDPEPTSISSEGASFQLNQLSRHAIAILVTIPGSESPELAIGEAEHKQTGHTSSAMVEVSNPGTSRVRPLAGEFLLETEDGFEMLRRDVSMPIIYAGHDTHLQVGFGERLDPGNYYISLSLADEDQGISASAERIGFHVPEPETIEAEDGGLAGLLQPPRLPGGDGSGSWLTLIAIIAGVSLLAAVIGLLIGRRRSRANAGAMSPDPDFDPEPQPATTGQANLQPSTSTVVAPQTAAPARKPAGLKPLLPKRQLNQER